MYERELLKGLAGLGMECHILLARGKPHDRDVRGWTIHPVWPPKGLRWGVTPFVFPRYIKHVYDRFGFDLLRAHSVRYIGPAALLARRLYRLPVPLVTHHHHLDPSPLNPIIEKRVLQASDRVITDSEFAKRQLVGELHLSVEHVDVVYCGVGSKFVPMPKDPTLLRKWGVDRKHVLLCMAPLIERKNPFFLLDAFAEVRRTVGGDAVLMWIGDGPLREPLIRQAASRGLDRAVIFTGYIPEEEKVATINLSDVFVFPSLLEGYALAPQEAMACGKPMVAFRVASFGEMVEDGVSSFLVAANDRQAFVERIVLLLAEPELRARLGWEASKRVVRWDLTVQEVKKIYERVVEARILDEREGSRRIEGTR